MFEKKSDSLIDSGDKKSQIDCFYNMPEEFFSLMLGPELQHSYGYFLTPDDDLDIAQIQQLDHICQKLALKPGNSLLDIGCGWGGLMKYASKNYGVHANGVDLYQSHIDVANKRISENGLSEACHAEVCDYRDITDEKQYDFITCICLSFESFSKQFFEKMYSLLKPGGKFLILNRLLNSYKVLPPYHVYDNQAMIIANTSETLESILENAKYSGFEIVDTEDHSDYYELTYKKWVGRMSERYYELTKYIDAQSLDLWINLYTIEYKYLARNEITEAFMILFTSPDTT